MFYSENVLTRKGPLANIWLAAHWDRKLTKSQIVHTNIQSSVDEIVKGALPPMALRLSGQLLLGASRIYWRKARYLLEDCSETLDRLKLNFKTDAQVDLPLEQSRAPLASITLSTNYTATTNNLMLPEPELDLDEILNMVATQPAGLVAGADKENAMKEKFSLNKAFSGDKHPAGDAYSAMTAANDSLLQAFPMSEDFEIETGRRLTDLSGLNMSRDTNPFVSRDSSAFNLLDDSIEAGRRELSVTSALSPMRLPGKMDENAVSSPLPQFDDGTWDDAMPLGSPLVAAEGPAFNTPPKPAKASTAGAKKRKVALDEVTELSSTQIQKQVKDTSDILLKKKALKAEVLTEDVRRMSLTSLGSCDEAAALLARPAFEGDLIMDTFGDLFRNNPLSVAAAQAANAAISTMTPVRSEKSAAMNAMDTPMMPMMSDDYDLPVMEDFNNTPVVLPSSAVSVDVLESVKKGGVSLQSIIAGQNRSTAAKAFFDVLALSAKSQLRPVQESPFGQITLSVL